MAVTMMIEIALAGLELTLGVFLVSSALFYAVWSNLRKLFLRQSFFQIRDELWIAAARLERLTDPAYLQARDRLNMLIVYGHNLSVPLLLAQAESASCRQYDHTKTTDCYELNQAISNAYNRAAFRLTAYLVRDRLPSFLLAIAQQMMYLTQKRIKEFVFSWMEHDGWREFPPTWQANALAR